MGKYALIGGKLGHSYSPMIHKQLGEYIYELREVDREHLESLLRSDEYGGFNVTIPYKKTVMEYCDEIAPEALQIGSVNVIAKSADGRMIGYNSDYYGFKYLIDDAEIYVDGKKCIVLGTGGASVTVQAVLKNLNAKEVVVISRNGEDNYENIHKHFDAEIIVNATPIGMYPNNGKTLLNLDEFKRCEGVLDVVYNPNKTHIVLDAEARGIPAAGGLAMLVAQAKKTSELLTGKMLDPSVIDTVLAACENEMLNIVLIGHDYAKVAEEGRKLAEAKGKEFVKAEPFDNDEKLRELFEQKGKVISVGESVIDNPENFYIVKENGIVVWVKSEEEDSSSKKRYNTWSDCVL